MGTWFTFSFFQEKLQNVCLKLFMAFSDAVDNFSCLWKWVHLFDALRRW